MKQDRTLWLARATGLPSVDVIKLADDERFVLWSSTTGEVRTLPEDKSFTIGGFPDHCLDTCDSAAFCILHGRKRTK